MPAEATPAIASHASGLDRTTVLSCTAKSWACAGGNIVELRVAGEIDHVSRPALLAAMDAALHGAVDRTARHLVVDLSAVTFCCVRGFAVFVDTGLVAAASGIGYASSGLPPHVERHARMLWADLAPIRRYRSAAMAITALRVEQAAAGAG